eukprot:11303620-Alexandrium_andersonii.AAC.1
MPAGEPHPAAASLSREADGAGIPRLSVPGVGHLEAAARSDPIRGLLGRRSRQWGHVDALIVEARVAVGQVANHQPCPNSPSQP